MHSLIEWLKAGSPAHYLWLVGAAILIVEDVIARSRLASNSTIQLVSQLLAMIPGLGKVLGVLAPKGPPDVLRVLLIVGLGGMVLAGSGCSMATYYRSVASGAVAVSGCYKGLAAADHKMQGDIQAEAKAGRPADAQAHLGAWLSTYDKARKGCDGAEASVEEAMARAPDVEAALDRKKAAAPWLALMAKVGIDVAQYLAEAGVIGGVQ